MRVAAALLVAVLAAGCGGTKHAASMTTAHTLAVSEPSGAGHWTMLTLSPDRSTYLGQWSGECEVQTAYFVDASGGKPRPITDYSQGSAQSIALGWAGSKARVRLPQGQPPQLKPGVYLVDPGAMKMTLERRVKQGAGC